MAELNSGTDNTQVYYGDILTLRRQIKSMGFCKVHIYQSMVRARKIDVPKYMAIHWGRDYKWECLVEDKNQMSLYRPGDVWDKPSAVWPIFNYRNGQPLEDLLGYCKHPWGDRDDLRKSAVPADHFFAPVVGQEHVVWTSAGTFSPVGGNIMKMHEWVEVLDELREEYGVKFGITGSRSYKLMFSGDTFDYAAVGTSRTNSGGRFMKPYGGNASIKNHPHEYDSCRDQVRILGFDDKKVENDFNELALANLASIQYASLHWNKDGLALRKQKKKSQAFVPSGESEEMLKTLAKPASQYQDNLVKRRVPKKRVDTDKILCTSCSLSKQCSYYRIGSVCTVPKSEGRELAKMFASRDPNKIIDALGSLNERMTKRALDAMDDELPTEDKALDPTVTTALNQVFANGVKLAKLIDPKLNGGVNVQVGVGITGPTQAKAERISQGVDTRQLAGQVIAELEQEGYDRSQITESMIRDKLSEHARNTRALGAGQEVTDAEVVEDE